MLMNTLLLLTTVAHSHWRAFEELGNMLTKEPGSQSIYSLTPVLHCLRVVLESIKLMAYRGSPKWAEKRFSHVTGESHQVERRSYKMPLGKAFWALSSTLSHPSFSIRNGLGLQLSSFISLFPAYFLPVSSLKTQRPLFILNYLCSFQFKLMLLKIYDSYRSNYSLLR